MRNKRGVSIIIGYVLLIVIAIGLSVAVFNFLRVYIPKDKVECETDIKLIVDNAVCTISGSRADLDITLSNRGLFSADGAFIRMAPVDRQVRPWINNYNDPSLNIDELSQFRFCPGGTPSPDCPLAPQESYQIPIISTSKVDLTKTEYTLEVQPAIVDPEDPAGYIVCEQAVITQPITCQ